MKKYLIYIFLICFGYSDNLSALKYLPNVIKGPGHDIINPIMKAGSLSRVTYDMLKLSKIENIQSLMELAVKEKRINYFSQFKHIKYYKNLPKGDEILYRCLSNKSCDLTRYTIKINKIRKSETYGQLFERCLKIDGCDPITMYDLSSKSAIAFHIINKYPALSKVQLNHKVGKLTELMMDQYFSRSGWRKIEGEVGRNGVDGLYIRKDKFGNIKRVLFVESKYNKSQLSQQQMTKRWILDKLDALIRKYPASNEYRSIKKMVENDIYQRRLWRMKESDGKLSITLKKITEDSSGRKISNLSSGEKTKINYNGNSEIDLKAPANVFQKEMRNTYFDALSKI